MSSKFQLETIAGIFSVIDYGSSGPDCLLIHGTGQNAAAWNGVARTLAGRARTVAFDMRGHGQTRPVSLDPEQYWRDIGPVSDALGMRSPILIGHSTGAYAATAYAAAGGHVAQIVCIDGFTLDVPGSMSDPAGSAPARATNSPWRCDRAKLAIDARLQPSEGVPSSNGMTTL